MKSVNMLMLGFAAFVNAKPFILSDEITSIRWYNFEETTRKIASNSSAEQLFLDVRNKII